MARIFGNFYSLIALNFRKVQKQKYYLFVIEFSPEKLRQKYIHCFSLQKKLREQEKKNPENRSICKKYKVPPSVTKKHVAYKFILLNFFCYCKNLKLFLMN